MGITDNPDKTHCFSGSEKNPMKSLGGFPWSSPGTCGGSRYGERHVCKYKVITSFKWCAVKSPVIIHT